MTFQDTYTVKKIKETTTQDEEGTTDTTTILLDGTKSTMTIKLPSDIKTDFVVNDKLELGQAEKQLKLPDGDEK